VQTALRFSETVRDVVRWVIGGHGDALVDMLVRRYMSRHAVPGISIAVSRNERLVLVRQYGLARLPSAQPAATADPVEARHRFRIASVSKPLTAAAVLTLVEAGHLRLSDHVFGPRGILGPGITVTGALPYTPRIRAVTVEQLLSHTTGGWRNDGSDPMFQQPALSADQLIAWTLQQPQYALLEDPGQTWRYSNFGYCVLGRVIEEVSGLPYAQYVQENVLARCGITGMRIASRTPADPSVDDEVVYYGEGGTDPFWNAPYAPVMQVERMDAHGGWTATPVDLLRFLARVDLGPGCPDILGQDSELAMFTPLHVRGGDPGNRFDPNYGLGWHSTVRDLVLPPTPIPLPPVLRGIRQFLQAVWLVLPHRYPGTVWTAETGPGAPSAYARRRTVVAGTMRRWAGTATRVLGSPLGMRPPGWAFARVWHDGVLPGTVSHLRGADLPYHSAGGPSVAVAVLANGTPAGDRFGLDLGRLAESIVAAEPRDWPLDEPL
jgi:D-alanyl-D-alanine carboxypeptidase